MDKVRFVNLHIVYKSKIEKKKSHLDLKILIMASISQKSYFRILIFLL
jgi:hypothetical protein